MAGKLRDAERGFDVAKYADSLPVRERQSTLLDEETTEQARIASVLMDSNPPTARASLQPRASLSPPDIAFYRARLAPMTRVPKLTRSLAELGDLIEDPKSAFVLGFVDGLLPLETIVEVAGLPELETLRILDRAITQGAVALP